MSRPILAIFICYLIHSLANLHALYELYFGGLSALMPSKSLAVGLVAVQTAALLYAFIVRRFLIAPLLILHILSIISPYSNDASAVILHFLSTAALIGLAFKIEEKVLEKYFAWMLLGGYMISGFQKMIGEYWNGYALQKIFSTPAWNKLSPELWNTFFTPHPALMTTLSIAVIFAEVLIPLIYLWENRTGRIFVGTCFLGMHLFITGPVMGLWVLSVTMIVLIMFTIIIPTRSSPVAST